MVARAAFSIPDQRAGNAISEEHSDVARPSWRPLRCRNPALPSLHRPRARNGFTAPFGGWGPNRLCGKLRPGCSTPAFASGWMGKSRRPESWLAGPAEFQTSFVQRLPWGRSHCTASTALAAAGDRAARPLWLPPGDQQSHSGGKGILTAPDQLHVSYVYTNAGSLRLDQMARLPGGSAVARGLRFGPGCAGNVAPGCASGM